MYKTIRQQIRPNTDVEFYSPENSSNITQDMKRYLFFTYVSTGKQLDVEKTISEDGLTQTITILWDSEESNNEYMIDPITEIIKADSDAYRKEKGIRLEIISRVEV